MFQFFWVSNSVVQQVSTCSKLRIKTDKQNKYIALIAFKVKQKLPERPRLHARLYEQKHQNNVQRLFKVNNKDTKLTSMALLWSLLFTFNIFYTFFYCFFIVEFEQVKICRVSFFLLFITLNIFSPTGCLHKK